jgi:hypothetical protein
LKWSPLMNACSCSKKGSKTRSWPVIEWTMLPVGLTPSSLSQWVKWMLTDLIMWSRASCNLSTLLGRKDCPMLMRRIKGSYRRNVLRSIRVSLRFDKLFHLSLRVSETPMLWFPTESLSSLAYSINAWEETRTV